jgi:hypothetical protein
MKLDTCHPGTRNFFRTARREGISLFPMVEGRSLAIDRSRPCNGIRATRMGIIMRVSEAINVKVAEPSLFGQTR